MPIYKPNTLFTDCWSSIGQISFFHRDGVSYFRTKPSPIFPGTPDQLRQASLHCRAILAWQRLTSSEQLSWREYALTVHSHRPPYKEGEHISGYNLFLSAYHGFAQLGNEHVPVPAEYPKFPEATIIETSAVVVGSTDLQIDCQVLLDDCTDPERFRLISRIQLTRPGGGLNQSLMRSFLSVTRAWAPHNGGYLITVRFLLPDYRNIWHMDLPSYTLHMRGRLLDTITGYRNNIIKGKFQIQL